MRNAVQEVQRSIQRIDHEAVRLVGADNLAGFLHQVAIAGPGLLEALEDDFLGLLVGGRNEVGRSLARNLQILDLPEIADKPAARGARGIHHHADGGGGTGHVKQPWLGALL